MNKLTFLPAVVKRFLAEKRAELDEKSLLMTLFVVAAVVGLPALATAINGTFAGIVSQL